MITKSPSGALSPYYYKGGYFHGIHYGSYFQDTEGLYSMMEQEEQFILKSPEKRRILIDLYETELSGEVIEHMLRHIERLRSRIIKLSIVTDHRSLARIRKTLRKADILNAGQLAFGTDMEECKTWLVSDGSRSPAL